jgi:hypothetical protein
LKSGWITSSLRQQQEQQEPSGQPLVQLQEQELEQQLQQELEQQLQQELQLFCRKRSKQEPAERRRERYVSFCVLREFEVEMHKFPWL